MMDAYVWWAVIGIGLIIVEMMTGTVFLLVLGLAALVTVKAGAVMSGVTPTSPDGDSATDNVTVSGYQYQCCTNSARPRNALLRHAPL